MTVSVEVACPLSHVRLALRARAADVAGVESLTALRVLDVGGAAVERLGPLVARGRSGALPVVASFSWARGLVRVALAASGGDPVPLSFAEDPSVRALVAAVGVEEARRELAGAAVAAWRRGPVAPRPVFRPDPRPVSWRVEVGGVSLVGLRRALRLAIVSGRGDGESEVPAGGAVPVVESVVAAATFLADVADHRGLWDVAADESDGTVSVSLRAAASAPPEGRAA